MLIPIIIASALAYAALLYFPKEIKKDISDFQYKMARDYSAGTSLSCTGLLFTWIEEDTQMDGDDGNDKVSAEVSKSTTDLALTIKEDTIEIITTAAVESGISNPVEYAIISNTDDQLVAAGTGDGLLSTVHAFILNKKNGSLLWSKTTSLFGSYGFMEHMDCR